MRVAAWWTAPARHPYITAGLIGLALFLVVFGPGYMFGTSSYWDLPVKDARAYMMGYRYFLEEDWHWPIFATKTMNVPYAKSIAFTDSIPAWALIHKSIATVVPPWGIVTERAYVGLWYALVFALQPVAAVACMRILGHRSRAAVIVTSILFLALPAWTFRFFHASLLAHFLLLWAIYLYLRSATGTVPAKIRVVQIAQLAVCSMVNPYLTVMSLGVLLASLLQSRRWKTIALWLPAGFAIIAVTSFLAGYFARDAKAKMFGFDVASTNMLSMFVPRRSGIFGESHLADATGYQYEGIAYLGLGVLIVLALFLPHLRLLGPAIRRHRYLFGIVLVAWLFALSNHVHVGSHSLLSYRWPSALTWIADQFRAPGRFVWLPMYMIVIYLLGWAFANLRQGWKLVVLPVLAIVQLVDASGDLRVFREQTRVAFASHLNLDGWRSLIARHDVVMVLPSYDCLPAGTPGLDLVSTEIEYLTSERTLPINGVYSARPSRNCSRDQRMIPSYPLPGVLYVFLAGGTRHAARFEQLGATCAAFDFGRVCSMHDAAITAALTAGTLKPPPPAPALAYRTKIDGSAASQEYFASGWSWPEDGGRWSDGPAATLVFALTGDPPPGVALHLQASAPLCGDRTGQEVEVLIEGVAIGSISFDASSNDPGVVRTLPIARPELLRGPITLELRPRDFRDPKTIRCNDDQRALGVMLRSISFE